MQILNETPTVSPDLIATRSGNAVTMTLFYGLDGYEDPEFGYYVFEGDATIALGGFSDWAQQSPGGDRVLYPRVTVTLTPGQGVAGSFSVNDYYDGTQLQQDFTVWVYTTAGARMGGAGMDIVFGGAGNDTLNGGAGKDALEGGAGNDSLIGGLGDDGMFGGAGDDVYTIDSVLDLVSEEGGSGNDIVRSSVTLDLGKADQFFGTVEHGVLLGSSNLQVFGTAGVNHLTGNSGNNVLNGRGGADRMAGLAGDDRYYVDNAGDLVNEAIAGSSGRDIIYAAISYDLADVFAVQGRVEVVRLTGLANLALGGSALGDVLTGNIGANAISGRGGADYIDGKAGNDLLLGGGGADRFIFTTANGSAVNIDRISDFNPVDDSILLDNAAMVGLGPTLGVLNAAWFRANSTGTAQDADDRILYETDTGRLVYDSNGSAGGGIAFTFAILSPNLALTAADFSVI